MITILCQSQAITWVSNITCRGLVLRSMLSTRRAHEIRYLRLHYYHWIDTSAGGLVVLEGIICPVVSVSITGSIPQLVD